MLHLELLDSCDRDGFIERLRHIGRSHRRTQLPGDESAGGAGSHQELSRGGTSPSQRSESRRSPYATSDAHQGADP